MDTCATNPRSMPCPHKPEPGLLYRLNTRFSFPGRHKKPLIALAVIIILSLLVLGVNSNLLAIPLEEIEYRVEAVIQTADGGFALAGGCYRPGQQYTWLAKTNSTGNIEWSRTFRYGTRFWHEFNSLIQTADGGFALAIGIDRIGPGDEVYDFWLVKTDAEGIVQWDKTYGLMASWGWVVPGLSLFQTADGGFALVGSDWLVKTDSTGNIEWNRMFKLGTGVSGCGFNALIQTADGGFALAGGIDFSSPESKNFWLVKTDAEGIEQWNKTYWLAGWLEVRRKVFSLVQTADGGFALAGYASHFSHCYYEFWLIKTAADGTIEWNRTYGDFQAWSLVQTADGGFALAGGSSYWGSRAYGEGDFADFWLVKTAADGTAEWNSTYRGMVGSLVQTADGGFALAGSEKISSSYYALLVKIDPDGVVQWTSLYPAENPQVRYLTTWDILGLLLGLLLGLFPVWIAIPVLVLWSRRITPVYGKPGNIPICPACRFASGMGSTSCSHCGQGLPTSTGTGEGAGPPGAGTEDQLAAAKGLECLGQPQESPFSVLRRVKVPFMAMNVIALVAFLVTGVLAGESTGIPGKLPVLIILLYFVTLAITIISNFYWFYRSPKPGIEGMLE